MSALDALPTFADLAQSAISRAGDRDKTITIKIALPTARMMVEAEGANALLSAKFEIIRLRAENTEARDALALAVNTLGARDGPTDQERQHAIKRGNDILVPA